MFTEIGLDRDTHATDANELTLQEMPESSASMSKTQQQKTKK